MSANFPGNVREISGKFRRVLNPEWLIPEWVLVLVLVVLVVVLVVLAVVSS